MKRILTILMSVMLAGGTAIAQTKAPDAPSDAAALSSVLQIEAGAFGLNTISSIISAAAVPAIGNSPSGTCQDAGACSAAQVLSSVLYIDANGRYALSILGGGGTSLPDGSRDGGLLIWDTTTSEWIAAPNTIYVDDVNEHFFAPITWSQEFAFTNNLYPPTATSSRISGTSSAINAIIEDDNADGVSVFNVQDGGGFPVFWVEGGGGISSVNGTWYSHVDVTAGTDVFFELQVFGSDPIGQSDVFLRLSTEQGVRDFFEIHLNGVVPEFHVGGTPDAFSALLAWEDPTVNWRATWGATGGLLLPAHVEIDGAHAANPDTANRASYGNDGMAWEGATLDANGWNFHVEDATGAYELRLESDGMVTIPAILAATGANNIMLYAPGGGGIALNGANTSIYSGAVHHLATSVDYKYSSGTALGWTDNADSTAGAVDLQFARSAAKTLTLDDGAGGAADLIVSDDVTSVRGQLFGGTNAKTTAQYDSVDTTLATVTGLTANVSAGVTYSFSAALPVVPDTTGGSKITISGTATATSVWYEVAMVDNTTDGIVILERETALGQTNESTGVTDGMIWINGAITVNAGGTLVVQYAQSMDSGTSSVLRGATLKVENVN